MREACAQSFNAITVDSDTSTSDSLMVFATGANGSAPIMSAADPRFAAFQGALNDICLELALLIVKDGEGASKFITVDVEGASTSGSARMIAADIANSPLVKTALAANDANWGRVVMAAGKSGEPIDQTELSIWFGDVQVAKHGSRASDYDEERATAAVSTPEISIRVRVGEGPGRARVYTCDLTHAYVDINGALQNVKVVYVVSAALFNEAGDVLLAQRPEGKSMAGLWEFPGGKIEPGETPERALCRELEEELAIKVTESDLKPITFASHAYESFSSFYATVFFEEMDWNAASDRGTKSRLGSSARLADLSSTGRRYPAFRAIVV